MHRQARTQGGGFGVEPPPLEFFYVYVLCIVFWKPPPPFWDIYFLILKKKKKYEQKLPMAELKMVTLPPTPNRTKCKIFKLRDPPPKKKKKKKVSSYLKNDEEKKSHPVYLSIKKGSLKLNSHLIIKNFRVVAFLLINKTSLYRWL